jgi:predicted pyridoxine 5'-phosphate oxidase superfamily flavin-nucleotide-binding protein
MSQLYGEHQRAFQDMFDSRRLADAAEQVIVHAEFTPEDKAFIESRDMFFLSTIDTNGFPTTSYKGGDPGFVRVVDSNTLAFPIFDGNGMFYSVGNMAARQKVGILFIDFEHPHRVRLHGTASVDTNDELMMEYKEAVMIVRVKVQNLFINCPRYVHRLKQVEPSKNVPRPNCETPFAVWKRIDMLQDALPAKDQGKAEKAGGLMTIEEYFGKLAKGEG